MVVPKLNLLIVEDERSLARLFATELSSSVEPTLAHTVAEARVILSSRSFDAVLLDLRLPDGSGLDVLELLSARRDPAAVVVLTGNADLDSAIRAFRLGAFDYLTKPSKISDLERVFDRVRSRAQSPRPASPSFRNLIGDAPQLAEVRRLVTRVAPSDSTVLILGETGTGKDVVANLIHAQSRRATGPVVAVNCAALPRDLAESELFGHRRGAFTGADRDNPGLVAAASGGTLFLDEIGDLPLDLQAKLLRFLENGEARRVGDTKPYRADVRVVAATHRNLPEAAAANRFRADLFYRLSTVTIRLPALREIPADIPAIANHLLASLPLGPHRARSLSPSSLSLLSTHAWPGNVRELRNVLERAALLSDSDEITAESLELAPQPAPSVTVSTSAATIADMEYAMIRRALATHNGNKTAAAKSLGISLRTLYNKLEIMSPASDPKSPSTS